MRQCVLVIEVLNEEQGGHYQHESSLGDLGSTFLSQSNHRVLAVEVKLEEGVQGALPQAPGEKLKYKCSILTMMAVSSYRSKYREICKRSSALHCFTDSIPHDGQRGGG